MNSASPAPKKSILPGPRSSALQLSVAGCLLSAALSLPAFAQTNVFPSDGNVGIGTTNPNSARLVVASPQTTGNNTVVGEFTKDGGSNNYGSAILRLSRIVGSESVDIELNSGGAGPFRYGTYSDSLVVSNQNYTNGPYGSIHMVTNGAVRMTVGGGTLAGNVGIGSSTPQYTLTLGGVGNKVGFYSDTTHYNSIELYNQTTGGMVFDHNTAAGGGYTWQYAGAPLVTFQASGNVGIGTTTPDGKLNINNAPNTWTANGWCKGLRLDGIHAIEFGGGGGGASVKYGLGQSDNALYFFDTTAEDNGAPASYRMVLRDGNVGIGTTSPTHKLAVNGTVRAKEVIVDTGWADYVFAKGYRLTPLAEVEQHIEREGHLPGIPSSAEVAERGVNVGEIQAKLLAKLEEVTLHLISQEKAIQSLQRENAELRKQVEAGR